MKDIESKTCPVIKMKINDSDVTLRFLESSDGGVKDAVLKLLYKIYECRIEKECSIRQSNNKE